MLFEGCDYRDHALYLPRLLAKCNVNNSIWDAYDYKLGMY